MRKARCSYYHNCKSEVDSQPDIAFFEDCGPGTYNAEQLCKNCGFHVIAHKGGKNYRADHWSQCENFEPKGDQGFDRYYCGCRGWD